MTPYSRWPYHGPIVTGAQDQDNFVRNLITILEGAPPGWGGSGPVEPWPGPSPLSPPVAGQPPILDLPTIKLHCRVELDQTDEDSLLTNLEMAARIHTNNILRRTLDPATCPENVKQALLVLIAHWYRNREAVAAESLMAVPLAYSALLFPEREFPEGVY